MVPEHGMEREIQCAELPDFKKMLEESFDLLLSKRDFALLMKARLSSHLARARMHDPPFCTSSSFVSAFVRGLRVLAFHSCWCAPHNPISQLRTACSAHSQVLDEDHSGDIDANEFLDLVGITTKYADVGEEIEDMEDLPDDDNGVMILGAADGGGDCKDADSGAGVMM